MLKKINRKLAIIWQQRFYYLSVRFRAAVPVHSLSWVPDKFTMHTVGQTGIRIVENFCTPEESALLIDVARAQLGDKTALVNEVDVTGLLNMSGAGADDPLLLPLLYRSAILFGVAYTHVEKIVMVCATAKSEHDSVGHYAPPYSGGSQHVALVFLNEVSGEVGGDTVFEGMNLRVTPRAGRAVCWSLGKGLSAQDVSARESLPVAEGAEKWCLQIWLSDHALRPDVHGSVNPPQAKQGDALGGDIADAPDGVWAPQDIDLEAVFGQPDKMKGLL
jgi:hypothetical protein